MNILSDFKVFALAFFVVAVAITTFGVTAQSYNFEFVNVTTTVNVTNAPPEILDISAENPITLNAGGLQTVTCNATIRDWNGFNDIDVVNATFYYFENSSGPDHNNVHYTNTSCTETGNDGAFLANYSCSFSLWYYANNGTWTCNINANDTFGFEATNFTNTSINALFALNVTDVIDYGNLSVTDTSAEVTALVTNFGNTNINVSVLGYGAVEGDGLGFVCTQGSNITVENQRFSYISSIWDDKNPLSGVNQDVNLTLSAPLQETVPVTSNTYWQLYVPPNPFGVCNGVVRFTATTP